jgi:hypothetical protein
MIVDRLPGVLWRGAWKVLPEDKLTEYLRSARDYCSPHPGLTKAQLLFEMERAKRTIDYVLTIVRTPGVSSCACGTCAGQDDRQCKRQVANPAAPGSLL